MEVASPFTSSRARNDDRMSIIAKALKKAQDDRKTKRVKSADLLRFTAEELFQDPKFDELRDIPDSKRGTRALNRFLPIALFATIIAGSVVGVLYHINRQDVQKSEVRGQKPEEKSQTIELPAESQEPAVPETKIESIIKPKIKPVEPGSVVENMPAEEQMIVPKKTVIPAMPRKLPTLTGIMYSPVKPQAIIDGMLVTEGEALDNVFVVFKISPNKVTLTANDGPVELRLR